jgi:hypothetical protein
VCVGRAQGLNTCSISIPFPLLLPFVISSVHHHNHLLLSALFSCHPSIFGLTGHLFDWCCICLCPSRTLLVNIPNWLSPIVSCSSSSCVGFATSSMTFAADRRHKEPAHVQGTHHPPTRQPQPQPHRHRHRQQQRQILRRLQTPRKINKINCCKHTVADE